MYFIFFVLLLFVSDASAARLGDDSHAESNTRRIATEARRASAADRSSAGRTEESLGTIVHRSIRHSHAITQRKKIHVLINSRQYVVIDDTSRACVCVYVYLFQASIPYNPSNPSCQQANRCNTNSTNVQLPTSNNVQGVNVLPIPITVPIVSTELFSHPLQVSPGSTHDNVGAIIPSQQQPQQMQQQPQPQRLSQRENSSNPELVSFQICPQQAEMMYGNIEPSSNQQQRPAQN